MKRREALAVGRRGLGAPVPEDIGERHATLAPESGRYRFGCSAGLRARLMSCATVLDGRAPSFSQCAMRSVLRFTRAGLVWIVSAHFLGELAVPRIARVGRHDVVEG